MKKLIASAFSAVAMLFGVAAVAGTAPEHDGTSVTAAVVRPAPQSGPDGIEANHNETLVRDES